jgi:hypothetical protein
MEVPLTLRRWFVVHFVVNLVIGLPLLFAPALLLRPLGWTTIDGAAVRLVGAALLAIGGQSFLGRNGGVEQYTVMLNLKIIWSFAAIAGLLVSIGEGAPSAVWALLSLFLCFAGVWSHYRIRFKQLAGAMAVDDAPGPDADDESEID